MGKIVRKGQYERLLSGLRRILDAGRRRAEEVVGRQMVDTYWAVGEKIEGARLLLAAGMRDPMIVDLAADLDLEVRTLQRAALLYRTYPSGAPDAPLSWTHYRKLLSVESAEARSYYQQLAVRKSLSTSALEEAIREQRFELEEEAKAGGRRAAHSRRVIKRPEHAFYLFKAIVERVVDGDTVIALLDMGFQTYTKQRIRFAKVNTPPLREPLGRQGEAFRRAATGGGRVRRDSDNPSRRSRALYWARVLFAG